MRELLRPPLHRGPLIASGAVLLAAGVALMQLRLEPELGVGVHLAVLGLAAALLLALGLQFPLEGGRPTASASALTVAGLFLGLGALVRLAEVLGADGISSGTATWVALAFGALALVPAVLRRSAASALLAVLAFVVALLSAWRWVFEADSAAPYRWLLLGCAVTAVLISLVLRAPEPRHSTQLVNAAGLCMLGLALTAPAEAFESLLFGGPRIGELPGFFELALLAAACGLLAYGAVDREPGPVLIGLANLAAFVLLTAGGERTLLGWPLALLLLGGGAMAAGLRPRAPLPPEPEPGGRPLVATSVDDETVIRVRHDS